MLPAFFHFVCMLFPCNQLFFFLFGNNPGGFHYIHPSIVCFLKAQLMLDVSVLPAIGRAVIMLVV